MARFCSKHHLRHYSNLALLISVLILFSCWYKLKEFVERTNPTPQPSGVQPKYLHKGNRSTSSDAKLSGGNSKYLNGEDKNTLRISKQIQMPSNSPEHHETNTNKAREEGFLEKVEYHVIKTVMQSLITSHNNRRKLLMNLQNTLKANRSFANTRPTNTTNLKKILFYTNFFGRSSRWKEFLGNSTDLHSCAESRCFFTTQVSEANNADAIIFHDMDFRPSRVPKIRHPHQQYIWLTHEAPERSKSVERLRERSWAASFFNWTMTYHRDSEIFIPYGSLTSLIGEADPARPLLNRSGVTYHTYVKALEVEALPGRPLGHTDQVGQEEGNWTTFLTRPKLVAWMVSHCTTFSGRELYIQELGRYIDVDVYGKCGNLTCGRSHHDTYCYRQVLSPTYKFYLAFENNLCTDYLTEKVWYPLHYGLVPVVYGGAHYSHFLPPHSYIDATDLTPRQLADLLTRVAASPTLYARYHLWRKYWQVVFHPPMCELCRLLHQQNHYSQIPTQIHGDNTGTTRPSTTTFVQDTTNTHDTTQTQNTTNDLTHANTLTNTHNVSLYHNTTNGTIQAHYTTYNTTNNHNTTKDATFTHNSAPIPKHPAHAPSLMGWWLTVNNCTTRYPMSKYPRTDTISLLRTLKTNLEVLGDEIMNG